ncbi:hypothetical protein, partial [Paenibacillus thalictri]
MKSSNARESAVSAEAEQGGAQRTGRRLRPRAKKLAALLAAAALLAGGAAAWSGGSVTRAAEQPPAAKPAPAG